MSRIIVVCAAVILVVMSVSSLFFTNGMPSTESVIATIICPIIGAGLVYAYYAEKNMQIGIIRISKDSPVGRKLGLIIAFFLISLPLLISM